MRAALLILPFLALLVGAVGTAIGSAFPGIDWISPAGWALAAAIVALWIVLDIEGFKSFFARKGAKYGASSGVVVILGVLVIIGVASVTARPRFNKSLDVTREGINTLSDQSHKIVKKLSESSDKVKITAFFIDDQVEQNFRDLLHLYQSAGADMAVEFIDPQTDPLRAQAEKLTSGNTVIFRYGNQENRITTFTEEKFTNALVNVLKEGSKKIYFTTGHGEGAVTGTEENGFSIMADELKANKYEVQSLSLLQEAKVPEDADLVVIAGPKYDFKEEELRFIEDYLKRGGSLLVMVDAMTPVEKLNKTLEKYGIRYNDDLLILAPNDQRALILGQNNAIVSEFDDFNPVSRDFAAKSQVALLLRNTRSLSQVSDNAEKMKVDLAAKTAPEIVRVTNVRSEADLRGLTEDRLEMGTQAVIAVATGKVQAPATAQKAGGGDAKTDVPASPEARQGEETRIVAVGSVQFANNAGAQAAEHRDMFLNMTSYLLQDEDFISIRPKDPAKTTLDLASSQSQLLLLMLAFIYPFVFMGTGVVHWLKRRRA